MGWEKVMKDSVRSVVYVLGAAITGVAVAGIHGSAGQDLSPLWAVFGLPAFIWMCCLWVMWFRRGKTGQIKERRKTAAEFETSGLGGFTYHGAERRTNKE
jgi:hypothetical protein